MKPNLKGILFATTLCAGTAASATALPFSPVNERTVQINDPAAGEISVQRALDQIFAPLAPVYGVPDADIDQSIAGMWGLATYPGGILPAIAFEQSSAADSNTYGIWSWSDALGLVKVPIFLGPATPLFGPAATAFLTWSNLCPSPGVSSCLERVCSERRVRFGEDCAQADYPCDLKEVRYLSARTEPFVARIGAPLQSLLLTY